MTKRIFSFTTLIFFLLFISLMVLVAGATLNKENFAEAMQEDALMVNSYENIGEKAMHEITENITEEMTDTLQTEEVFVEETACTVIIIKPPETEPEETESMEMEKEPDILSNEAMQIFSSFDYKGKTYKLAFDKDLQAYTYDMAVQYKVPYRAILGLMGAESWWTANIGSVVHSGRTYVGLGMLNEEYYAEIFAKRGIDIYTPKGNIEAICWLMKDLLELFDGDIHKALMAYNGGTAYARRQIAKGIYESSYSKKVIAFAESFK